MGSNPIVVTIARNSQHHTQAMHEDEEGRANFAGVAQLVEQRIFNSEIEGSSPSTRTTAPVVQLAETADLKSVKYGFKSRLEHQNALEGLTQNQLPYV